MKFENVAEEDAASEFLYHIVQGEVVLTDVQSVDPSDQQVLLERTYLECEESVILSLSCLNSVVGVAGLFFILKNN